MIVRSVQRRREEYAEEEQMKFYSFLYCKSVCPSDRPSVLPLVRQSRRTRFRRHGCDMWNAGMHTNGRTEILPCALQDIVPFGAAALHKL